MKRPPRRSLAVLPVAVLTLILTLLFSGGEGVAALLQVSPISTPAGSTPMATPTDMFFESPVEPLETLAPPTSVPVPPTIGPTPTVLGFLPAPTIVNPDEVRSLPLARPPSYSSAAVAEPTAVAPPATADPIARAAVALLNYLWLLCSGALLIGGVVAVLLVWRRGRHT